MRKTLYIVIPCYNEEDVLRETARQLLAKMDSMSKRYLAEAGLYL